MLILFDAVSHLAIVSSALACGGTTHKVKGEDAPWLLQIYYGTYLLPLLVACTEVLNI